MPKKVLFFATIHKHFLAFHIPYIKWFKEHGYEVHVAANDSKDVEVPYADKQIEICVERNPFHKNNIKAVKQLRELDRDRTVLSNNMSYCNGA